MDSLETHYQSSLRAGTAGRVNNMINDKIPIIGLSNKFKGAVHVAKSPGCIGAPTGDRVDISPLTPEVVGHSLHFGIHVEPGSALLRACTVKEIEQDIAVVVVVILL